MIIEQIRRTWILLVFLLVFLCISCGSFLLYDSTSSPGTFVFMGILCSLAGVACLVANKIKYLKDKNWFSVEIMFYLVFWILHFLFACIWFSSDSTTSCTVIMARYTRPYLDKYLPKVVLLSACGGLTFSAAFICFCRSEGRIFKRKWFEGLQISNAGKAGKSKWLLPDERGKRILLAVTCLSALISFFSMTAVIFYAGSDFFNSAYGGQLGNYIARVFNLLFLVFAQAGFVLFVVSLLARGFDRINIVLAVYYLAAMCFLLVLGDRGGVAAMVLSGLFVITTLRYRIRMWQLAVFVILGSALVFFAGIARQSEKRMPVSFGQKWIQAMKEHGLHVAVTRGIVQQSEIVLPCLIKSVKKVPDERPYFYGYWSLKGVLAAVPFHSRVFPFIDKSENMEGSASYLTWSWREEEGLMLSWNIGTTVVSDSYLDFGLPGVAVTLFICGVILGTFYGRIRSGDISVNDVFLFGIVAASMTLGARASLACVCFRRILWPLAAYCIILCISAFFVKSRTGSIKPEQPE